ncbi:hypothetical protein [Chondromyces apiculatus]|uniref:Uncharacterized protein n=1 Tax=Chondromyces apiculatus DSM 436 TaxID=1192034 RepID=A0A017TJ04_9BACT|nr:hypothetical protein [Chondromyces apiculatus]EYF08571.1 Hypothetical protein CAP_4101 [Chondromyces apiculatus DSM 436]
MPERQEFPKQIPYEEGMQIPDGYTLEMRARRGLVIAGAVTFGTMYGLSLIGGVQSISDGNGDFGALVVPLVGPFIALATSDASIDGELGAVLVVDGIAQIGGALMLLGGLLSQKKVLIRNDLASEHVEIVPFATGRGDLGLGIRGTM